MGFSPAFAIAAGYLSTLVARYFPGINIPKSQLVIVFVAGVAAVVVVVLKFLHSKDKRLGAQLGKLAAEANSEIDKLPDGALAESDVERLIESHLPQLEAALESKMPNVAAEVFRNLFQQLGTGPGQTPPPPAAAQVAGAPVAS